MSNYLIFTEKELEKVYKPSLQFLNDDFLPSNFPKSENLIKNNMSFYTLYCYGDSDFEKEYFDYKKFNIQNKNHHFKGINYIELNKILDFAIYEEELMKLVNSQEIRFIEELESKRQFPNFEIALMESMQSVHTSLIFLKSLNFENNRIKDITQKYFTNSYMHIVNHFKNKYFFLYEKSFFGVSIEDDFNKRLKKNNRDILDKNTLWFKVGLLLAEGKIQELKKEQPKISFDKMASYLGDNKYSVYIKATLNYYTKTNVDKNIYLSFKKMKSINDYCQSNDIIVCEDFSNRLAALNQN
jgi:hypothetical protein